jgi:sugar lactone lactonase YvrE
MQEHPQGLRRRGLPSWLLLGLALVACHRVAPYGSGDTPPDASPDASAADGLDPTDAADARPCEGPLECGDGFECTTDQCVAGHCQNNLAPLSCLIDEACVVAGAPHQSDPCLLCDPNQAPRSWTTQAKCVRTVAGDGTADFRNGAAADAQFYFPYSVDVDASGRIYVADANNHRLRLIENGMVSTLAGTGESGHLNGAAADAMFARPQGIATTSDGAFVYIADTYNYMIRAITQKTVVAFAGSGEPTSTNGEASVASFSLPTAVAVLGETVYVADTDGHSVRAITAGQVETIAGSGVRGFQEGPAEQAQFAWPTGIAVAADGTIYVADQGNHRIRAISGGQVLTVAGRAEPGSVNGPMASATFSSPAGVAVDASGAIYVADRVNNRIRRIADGQVETYAGTGVGVAIDGPAALAGFKNPYDVAVDQAGVVYVADQGTHRIRAITPP